MSPDSTARDAGSAISTDTIAAVSSPAGRGSRAIVRLSGPDAVGLMEGLFSAAAGGPLVACGRYTAADGTLAVDELRIPATIYLMRAPYSYTREDVVEAHLPGSPPIVQAVVEGLLARGARLAQPGEFTRRAFLNGRIDLAQAEAVLKIIRATTEGEHRAALEELEGGFSRQLSALRGRAIALCARIELGLDFSDEDIEIVTRDEVSSEIDALIAAVQSAVGDTDRRTSREGVVVALFGRANAGKSSLLNALAGEARAIVTHVPGTTRDTVEAPIQIDGIAFRLIDTAGFGGGAGDDIDAEAAARARRAVEVAEIGLFVLDASLPLDDEVRELWRSAPTPHRIVVLNKSDLPAAVTEGAAIAELGAVEVLSVSALTGEGVPALLAAMRSAVESGLLDRSTSASITTVRQRDALRRTLESLTCARRAAAEGLSDDFIAADLRDVLRCVGELTGEVVTDDILDVIFAEFCIGK